jgi:hypothetical protein
MLDRHDSSSVDVVVVEDLEVDDAQRLSIAFDDFLGIIRTDKTLNVETTIRKFLSSDTISEKNGKIKLNLG